MMSLDEYLKGAKLTRKEFASRIGVKPVSVYRYIVGERFPKPQVLAAIERETGGAVKASSFYEAAGAA